MQVASGGIGEAAQRGMHAANVSQVSYIALNALSLSVVCLGKGVVHLVSQVLSEGVCLFEYYLELWQAPTRPWAGGTWHTILRMVLEIAVTQETSLMFDLFTLTMLKLLAGLLQVAL